MKDRTIASLVFHPWDVGDLRRAAYERLNQGTFQFARRPWALSGQTEEASRGMKKAGVVTMTNPRTGELMAGGKPQVQEVMQAAQEHLQQLIRQRAELIKRIGAIKKTIVGLAILLGDDSLSEELQGFLDVNQEQDNRHSRTPAVRS
jgi:hypothetical protein